MRSDGIEIRPAVPEDAPGIAHVLVETWRSTFHGLLPDAFLQGLSCQQLEQRHLRAMRDPGNIYFVAVRAHDGVVVGFSSGGPIRTPCHHYASELHAIYVVRASQGLGIGRDLFRAFTHALETGGHSDLLVWVLAVNPFRLFYSRMGGTPVAEQSLELASGVTADAIAYGWQQLPRH